MNNKDLKNVFANIITTEDLNRFYDDINILSNSTFKSEKDIKDIMNETLTEEYSKTVYDFFKINNLDLYDPVYFQKGLDLLKETLDQCKKVNLSVPINFSDETIQSIYTWFDSNLDQKVVLDFLVDKSIIGGIQIGYMGRMKDYSLERLLLE